MRRFQPRSETISSGKIYCSINAVNLESTYGLRLVDYEVGEAKPDLKLIAVPGRPGPLDATLALNGKVNYLPRYVMAQFRVSGNSYAEYHSLSSSLSSLYNGKEVKVSFSSDPSWYYKGRFNLEHSKNNPFSSNFTLSCENCFPYKLESAVYGDQIITSGSVVCLGKEYNGPLTIVASDVMQLTFGGTTYNLVSGNNILRELHLAEGDNELVFAGNGTVSIRYERGIL